MGVRGWIVKQAIKIVSKGIRYGGTALTQVTRWLSGKEKTVLTKYSNKSS
jgi:hypothetical protein